MLTPGQRNIVTEFVALADEACLLWLKEGDRSCFNDALALAPDWLQLIRKPPMKRIIFAWLVANCFRHAVNPEDVIDLLEHCRELDGEPSLIEYYTEHIDKAIFDAMKNELDEYYEPEEEESV